MKKVDVFFEETVATELSELRAEARGKGRITYDCMNSAVAGESIICKKGYKLKGKRSDGSLGLLSVLRGHLCSMCRKCNLYDEETYE